MIKFKDPVYNIVENGAISTEALGEGRFIPTIVVDTEDNAAINELLILHKNSKPGDSEMFWCADKKLAKTSNIILSLKFLKPMELSFGINFSLENHSPLIDGIIQSRGFFFYVGKRGEKVSLKVDSSSESILVEVPGLGFDKYWDELFLNLSTKKFIKKGVEKSLAKILATQSIKSIREVWNTKR